MPLPRFLWTCVFILAPVLLFPVSEAKSQEVVTDLDAAREAISGARQRVWILEAVVAALGGEGCESGVRYRFDRAGTVSVERCVDGTWAVGQHEWRIDGGGQKLFTITLNQRECAATLRRLDDRLELSLISFGAEKDAETVRETLTYALD